jgi:hypothetical protein
MHSETITIGGSGIRSFNVNVPIDYVYPRKGFLLNMSWGQGARIGSFPYHLLLTVIIAYLELPI